MTCRCRLLSNDLCLARIKFGISEVSYSIPAVTLDTDSSVTLTLLHCQCTQHANSGINIGKAHQIVDEKHDMDSTSVLVYGREVLA